MNHLNFFFFFAIKLSQILYLLYNDSNKNKKKHFKIDRFVFQKINWKKYRFVIREEYILKKKTFSLNSS